MSVLVIGMDYPDNCLQCSFVRIVSGHYYCGCNANCMLGEYVGEHLEGVGRHEGCPLVELPEKHGRLIDADDFSAVMKERQLASAKWLREAKDAETINRADAVFAVLCEVKLTIGKLPTIVEAEK